MARAAFTCCTRSGERSVGLAERAAAAGGDYGPVERPHVGRTLGTAESGAVIREARLAYGLRKPMILSTRASRERPRMIVDRASFPDAVSERREVAVAAPNTDVPGSVRVPAVDRTLFARREATRWSTGPSRRSGIPTGRPEGVNLCPRPREDAVHARAERSYSAASLPMRHSPCVQTCGPRSSSSTKSARRAGSARAAAFSWSYTLVMRTGLFFFRVLGALACAHPDATTFPLAGRPPPRSIRRDGSSCEGRY